MVGVHLLHGVEAHSWFSEEVQQAPEGVAVLVERELDDAGPTEGV